MSFVGKTYNELENCFSKARKLGKSPFELLSIETKRKHESDRSSENEEMCPSQFTKTPSFVSAVMKDYQIEGLNWLVNLHENNLNGILADEMGLGKTLQTLSFLSYLITVKKENKPVMVVVPKSTLENWRRECEKWTPTLKPFVFNGDKEERKKKTTEMLSFRKKRTKKQFDLCLVSYEICLIEKNALSHIKWSYLVIDEAHRVKNENSNLSKIARMFNCTGRLLITGTPLQNNLHELWALLNFLFPVLFGCPDEFQSWLGLDEKNKERSQEWKALQLRKILSPFLLRRTKLIVEQNLLPKKEINIYVGLSQMQKEWYKKLLNKDVKLVLEGKGYAQLQNLLMQLRKCCNHPYLFSGAEPGPPYTTGEHIVQNSQKLVVLDNLLCSLKKKGSKILLFSQMSRTLDIIEDYCALREHKYCRIDGSTSHDERVESIDAFNQPNSDIFIFLLTTRAGGQGINLASADIVVLYDSDWNPQIDLQAMARAHRIGQKKQVYVFRMVTSNTVEEKILEKAQKKLRLDQIVIQDNNQTHKKRFPRSEITEMITHGLDSILQSEKEEQTTDNIDDIIKMGEKKTKELQSRFSTMGLDDLYEHSVESLESTKEITKKLVQENIYDMPSKRRRKIKRTHEEAPRPPKPYHLPSERLLELVRKAELLYIKRFYYNETTKTKGMLIEKEIEEKSAKEIARMTENVEELTDAEKKEMEHLMKNLFTDWGKKEQTSLVDACMVLGTDSSNKLHEHVKTKSAEEISSYLSTFLKSAHLYKKTIAKINESDLVHRRNRELQKKIKIFLKEQEYSCLGCSSYTKEEDLFLLQMLNSHGHASQNIHRSIQHEINCSKDFVFNWFFRSRTEVEIKKRCDYLVERITSVSDLYLNQPVL